jgi:hypothetical protein
LQQAVQTEQRLSRLVTITRHINFTG